MTPIAANIEAANSVADIHSRINDDRRVSLTDFARGKAWRKKLAEKGILELEDRSGRIAWIVSERDMTKMVNYITELETQMELESISAMFETRHDRGNWKSGSELAEAATKSLEARYDNLVQAVER